MSCLRLLPLLALAAVPAAHAIDTKLLSVETSVVTSGSPSVTHTWDTQATGGTVQIYRRDLGKVGTGTGNNFSLLATITHPTKTYTDTSITSGRAYEYRIVRPSFVYGGTTYQLTASYVSASIEAPLVDSRGTVLLVVDSNMAPQLAGELARLELDLAGDGWRVTRLDFAPNGSGTHQALKTAIQNARTADSSINALYLFGRLPVARSGMLAPDGHTPNRAHETDLYYADTNGSWTDSTVNVTAPNTWSALEQQNTPGDGKFDQTNLPSAIELMTGRVDFSKMVAHRKNEYELLRDYISKSHTWRFAGRPAVARGLIHGTEHLFMEHNWLRPMFGAGGVTAASMQPTLNTQDYVWAVGMAHYDGKSTEYTVADNRAVFFFNFASYKQHWNRADNPMRALLAQPDWGLTAAWGARPAWHMHHMSAGYPIGYSALRSINNYFNGGEYSPTGSYSQMTRYVSQNLMGDPTLRQHPVKPLNTLTSSGSGSTANLSWSAPSDSTRTGFHVYRATSRLGTYTRLTSSPLSAGATSYTDTTRPAGNVYYQVRAIARTSAPTGTYINQSQGVFTLLKSTGSANAVPSAPTPPTLPAATGMPTVVSFPGSDADGDALTPIIVENPANGALRWNAGTCVYVSDAGFTGLDTFTYRLSDGVNLSAPAIAVVDVAATRGDVLLAWEFGSPASGVLPATGNTYKHSLVQTSQITTGSGVTVSTNSTNTADAYHLTGVNSANLDANDWIGWTVAPTSGSKLDLDRLTFFGAAGDTDAATPSGTCKLQLRVSTNGFTTYTNVPLNEVSGTQAAVLNAGSGRVYTADLSGVSALQNLTTTAQFRLYVWGTANFALGKSHDTPARVAADLVLNGTASVAGSSNLTLHYAFDESSGTAVTDAATVGASHTVSSVAGLTRTTGKYGSAYAGSSAGIVVPNASELAPNPQGQAFSWSMWVKLTSTASTYRYLLDRTVSGNTQLGLRLWGDPDVVRVTHGNTSMSFDTGTLSNGNWHLLTLVNDNIGGTWKTRLYFDNGTSFVEFNTGGGGTVAADLRLGGDTPGNSYHTTPGHLDDVRVYNRALTSTEVAAIFNGNAP